MAARRVGEGLGWETVYGAAILVLMGLSAGIVGSDFLTRRPTLIRVFVYALSIGGAAGVGVLLAHSEARWLVVAVTIVLVTHGAWGLVRIRALGFVASYAALLVAALPIVAARRIALDSPDTRKPRTGLNAWLAVLVTVTPVAVLTIVSLRRSHDFLTNYWAHIAAVVVVGSAGQFLWWQRVVDLRESGLAEIAISVLAAMSAIGLLLAAETGRRLLVALTSDVAAALVAYTFVQQGWSHRPPPKRSEVEKPS